MVIPKIRSADSRSAQFLKKCAAWGSTVISHKPHVRRTSEPHIGKRIFTRQLRRHRACRSIGSQTWGIIPYNTASARCESFLCRVRRTRVTSALPADQPGGSNHQRGSVSKHFPKAELKTRCSELASSPKPSRNSRSKGSVSPGYASLKHQIRLAGDQLLAGAGVGAGLYRSVSHRSRIPELIPGCGEARLPQLPDRAQSGAALWEN